MRSLRVGGLLAALLFSILLPLRAHTRGGLTARDYYNELYAAGDLDGTAGTHVCFQDDPTVENFFVLKESKQLRDYMLADGSFSKLSKETQELMKRDILMVRGYAKGIPWRAEEFLEKDEQSWISDQRMLNENTPIRIRFTINWQTLRYKYAVEILNMDSSYRTEEASFGHCEEIPAEETRHGEE
jgi:hypothetical protein